MYVNIKAMCFFQTSGGSSGIRRNRQEAKSTEKSVVSEMSFQDKERIASIQRDIDYENESIPSFIREGMTEAEIQSAVIAEVRRTGNSINGISPQILDARYAEAKNPRFAPLIDGLNGTSGNGDREDYYIDRASELTSGYTTRELRSFVKEGLGEKIFRGGRKEYETTIGLNLWKKFTRGEKGGSIRPSLGQPDWVYIDRRIGRISNAITRRRIYQDRIAEIQAKYRKKGAK